MTMLNIKDVTLKFSNAPQPALNKVNYEVKRGDFVIVLGSNGSGKSTLLKMLYRHHEPQSGEVSLQGQPLRQINANKFSQEVGVLTQNFADSLFTSLTIYENYVLVSDKKLFGFSSQKDRDFLSNYLADYNPNLSKKLDESVYNLSGGEKQALALALCLLKPPSLLLLDEHTSALDPKTSSQIMALTQKMITRHHITCLLTTHDLDIALQYGNRILVLREGKVYKNFDKSSHSSLSKEILSNCYF